MHDARPALTPQGNSMRAFNESHVQSEAAARSSVPASLPSDSVAACNSRTAGDVAAEAYSDVLKCSATVGPDLERACFEQYEKLNWHMQYTVKGWGREWGIRVNPVSFGASVLLTWGFAIWCMVSPEGAKAKLGSVQLWLSFTFSWVYMLAQQGWVVFLTVLYFSRLGDLKLGQPDSEPDFPTASWFMMMFSAGIGIGLFFFGVAEPVSHYEPCGANPPAGQGSQCYGNRYAQLQDDERAQWAINMSFFHWGIHAWASYCIVGLLLGIMVYRKGFSMTMKSAFYPILKDKIYGWMGDTVDVVSVATTLFGICTSLGLGVQQINQGLQRLHPDVAVSERVQSAIIWTITAISTLSVITGVRVGIRRLSEVNFVMGQFLMMVVLLQDDTWYLLNNFTQSIGFYVQHFIQLGSHCNTFQMAPAETIDDGVHVTAVAPDQKASLRSWFQGNTLFYFSWWIAWSPFVGMFIAKISRGRTVRQVINGALMGPALYCFIWFAVFGGVGLRIERQAANLGITCATDDDGVQTFEQMVDGETLSLPYPVVELDGREFWRLSCRNETDMWFDMFANFPMTKFYWGLSLVSLILYFVTSSDSGSLVIDCLTANGNPHPPVLQRVFWSATEGAVAMALLKAAGSDGLQALQAVSIIAGLPYALVISFMCWALWDILSKEYDQVHNIERPAFNLWVTGIIDVLDYPTFSAKQARKTAAAFVLPFLYAAKGAAWADGVRELQYVLVYGMLFGSWVGLLVLNAVAPGLWVVAWLLYIAFSLHLAYERSNMRQLRNIDGTMVSDVLLSVLLCPFTAVQLHDEAVAALKEGTSNIHAPTLAADAAQAALHRTEDARGSPDVPKVPAPQPPQPQAPQQPRWYPQHAQHAQRHPQHGQPVPWPHALHAQHAVPAQHAQHARHAAAFLQPLPAQHFVAAAPAPAPQGAGTQGTAQPGTTQAPVYGQYYHPGQGSGP